MGSRVWQDFFPKEEIIIKDNYKQRGCFTMFENKFFRIAYSIILILLILFLSKQVDYIFDPIVNVISFLLYPLLLSVFFYFLMRPLVRLLSKKIKFKNLSILITFLLVISVIVSISYFGGSIIQKQIKELSHNFMNYYDSFRLTIDTAVENEFIQNFIDRYDIEEKLGTFVENVFNTIRTNIFGFFSKVTNIGTIVILIPFIIFYLLEDDQKIHNAFISILPDKFRGMAREILQKIDYTLSRYISGQFIVAGALGLLSFIGYSLIGLPYALILGIIAMIAEFIPFIGPILGILPAIFIAMTIDFFLILKVLIVLVTVQQLEGNLISPRLHGSRLQMHPLIVILMVMTLFTLFGVLGALFAVPTYTVGRIIIQELQKNKVNKKQLIELKKS